MNYAEIDGVRLRYAEAGSGPPLVLLHTLRTQLDMFHRVIPLLARKFRVIAVDYPGHGFSDIPRADYSAQYFLDKIRSFVDRMVQGRAWFLGESIGATLALALAAEGRAEGVLTVNT